MNDVMSLNCVANIAFFFETRCRIPMFMCLLPMFKVSHWYQCDT